jgi:hypothetical protein
MLTELGDMFRDIEVRRLALNAVIREGIALTRTLDRQCLLLAQSGHVTSSAECPLLGVKRTAGLSVCPLMTLSGHADFRRLRGIAGEGAADELPTGTVSSHNALGPATMSNLADGLFCLADLRLALGDV